MKKVIAILLISSFIGIITASCGPDGHNSVRRFTIEETYKIKAGMNRRSYLTVLLPRSYGYQRIDNIAVAGADDFEIEDLSDYSVLHAEINGNDGNITIHISYDVTLTQGAISWDFTGDEKNLEPEALIESDDHLIIETAKSQQKQDQNDTVRSISHFVSSEIKFDDSVKINVEPQNAVKTLTDKKGVCADYANLMTALLRADGIPARSVSGIVLNSLGKIQEWNHQGGSHAWVEFYVNGKWHFADPTWGDRYLDNSDGYHLSYGDDGLGTILYNKLLSSFKDDKTLTIIGAMSAPLKFILASTDSNATVIPSASVKNQNE